MNLHLVTVARRLAQQESRALRAYAATGRLPNTQPLKLPWHPGYINTNRELTQRELLPDHTPKPHLRAHQ